MKYTQPNAAQADAQIHLLAHTFSQFQEDERRWHEAIGAENHRIVIDSQADGRERVLAAGAFLPFGLMIGGRDVPVWGISGVGVDPFARGHGHGRHLMEQMNAEARAAGQAMAVLFASAPGFYRKLGYEAAGHYRTYNAPIGSFAQVAMPDGVRLVPLDPRERAPLADIRAEAERQGLAGTRRGAFLWYRAIDRWLPRIEIALIVERDRPVGYMALRTDDHDLRLVDHCALTPAAAEAILATAAGHRNIQSRLIWHGPPNDPLIMALPQTSWTIEKAEFCFACVLDPAAMIAARGYNPGLETSLVLAIAPGDDRPASAITVRITGGGATTAPADPGGAELTVDQRGLAPLLTGLLSASRLASMGRARGTPAAIARADLAFGGEPPFIVEFF